ncbi:hypothetical protein OPQ81_006501 [Rhizoctonia solani]|nr:hypothetical protein OPQ81_006501 [Rhizoctonia solani]
MTSRSQLPGAIAAARLAQTTAHLTGSGSPSGITGGTLRMASTGASSSSAGAPKIEFRDIKNVTCFGAGLMGAGIAQVAAQNGFKVTLCDITPQALENGLTIIRTSLGRIAKKAHPDSHEQQKSFVEGLISTITTTTDPQEAVKQADLVVEAIVENLEVKLSQRLQRAPASVDKQRLVAYISSTAPDEACRNVCKRMQKTSVSCKDTPGFIVNRLLVPYMLEAIRMLERGDASAEDIDTAMKLGAGYPMGPIQLTDFVGLDTCQHIMTGWREKDALSPELVQPIKALEEKVKEGKLGRKTGEGFFKY